AAVAPAGADLTELERSPEEPPQRKVELLLASLRLPTNDEIAAGARREAVFAGERDGTLGARVHAVGAEEASPHVEREPAAALGADRAGGTGIDAGAALVGPRAFAGVERRRSAKAIREN